MLLTDPGRYPDGMLDGRTMRVYENADDAVRIVHDMLVDPAQHQVVAAGGLSLMKNEYSKSGQWKKFQNLVT